MSVTRCGYRWNAPFIYPPSQVNAPRGCRPPEVCVLPEGHDGDHRSAFNVTAANAKVAPPKWAERNIAPHPRRLTG